MAIEKIRKRKDENIISGIEKKGNSFSPSSPLSLSFFYQIKKPNTHLPSSSFLLGKEKKESYPNLYFSIITTFL
jgi:hypothetical protein